MSHDHKDHIKADINRILSDKFKYEGRGTWARLKEQPMTLAGMKVVLDPHIEDYEQQTRSWKERLWSWPWSPWKATKAVYSPKILRHEDTIICSHRTYQDLKHQMDLQRVYEPFL